MPQAPIAWLARAAYIPFAFHYLPFWVALAGLPVALGATLYLTRHLDKI